MFLEALFSIFSIFLLGFFQMFSQLFSWKSKEEKKKEEFTRLFHQKTIIVCGVDSGIGKELIQTIIDISESFEIIPKLVIGLYFEKVPEIRTKSSSINLNFIQFDYLERDEEDRLNKTSQQITNLLDENGIILINLLIHCSGVLSSSSIYSSFILQKSNRQINNIKIDEDQLHQQTIFTMINSIGAKNLCAEIVDENVNTCDMIDNCLKQLVSTNQPIDKKINPVHIINTYGPLKLTLLLLPHLINKDGLSTILCLSSITRNYGRIMNSIQSNNMYKNYADSKHLLTILFTEIHRQFKRSFDCWKENSLIFVDPGVCDTNFYQNLSYLCRKLISFLPLRTPKEAANHVISCYVAHMTKNSSNTVQEYHHNSGHSVIKCPPDMKRHLNNFFYYCST
ncbi:hypothetical protein SNEBB_006864 [Seison nebaliae]|nr:hypothetical protein SNEBB_006864 [Seison nebaliae]